MSWTVAQKAAVVWRKPSPWMAGETLCVEGSLRMKGNPVAEETPQCGEMARVLREQRRESVRAFGPEEPPKEASRRAVLDVVGHPVVEPAQRNRRPLEVSHWG
jgi:hypothetical protein